MEKRGYVGLDRHAEEQLYRHLEDDDSVTTNDIILLYRLVGCYSLCVRRIVGFIAAVEMYKVLRFDLPFSWRTILGYGSKSYHTYPALTLVRVVTSTSNGATEISLINKSYQIFKHPRSQILDLDIPLDFESQLVLVWIN